MKTIQYCSTLEISFQLQAFLLFSSALTASLDMPDKDVFRAFVEEHKAVCPVYDTCGNGLLTIDRNVTRKCCGHCLCEPLCERFGNCCPQYFSNFSEGKLLVDRTRFRCVNLQYISSGSQYKNKHLAWMVSECPSNKAKSRNVLLCENPGKDDLLDTLIPVTDMATNTHYRNKYCAQCSDLTDASLLVDWKVEIYNDIYLNVPDDNLLRKIREGKGNIFYRPPDFVVLDYCHRGDSFTISKCNVSGKWSVYNESLERGCASFIDPFNHTYQNYFCFLCNSPAGRTLQSNDICQKESEDIVGVSPPFLAILDVSEATGKKVTEKLLTCTADQFSDMKKSVCRDIMCDENRQLAKGECVYHDKSIKDCSYSIFLKLTPEDGMLSPADISTISNDSLLHYTIIEEIQNHYLVNTAKFQVYGELNALGMFEYILVYIVVEFGDDIIQEFIQLGKANLTVLNKNLSEIFKVFHVDSGLYDIEHTKNDSFVSVIDEKGVVHFLPLLYDKHDTNTACGTRQVSVLNRLTLCPYVGFDMGEMNVTFTGDILIINGGWANTTDNVQLTRWEYERDGDRIHVCLDTFIDIYNKIPVDERHTVDVLEEVIGAKQIVSFVSQCVSLSRVLGFDHIYIFEV